MKNWIKLTLITTVSTALFLPVVHAQEETYYRYKDKDGHTVMGNTLPPEAASLGYDIISPSGNLIETVPAQASQAEIAQEEKAALEQKNKEQQAKIMQAEQAVQAHKDEILLKSFTSEADIIRSRDEKIASIRILEEIVNDNINRLEKQQLEAMNNHATNPQNAPQQKVIEENERQINENKAFLGRKKEEIERINLKYQGLIDRFRALQAAKPLNADQQ